MGRVTADTIFAERSMPSYHAAAMDGVAVRAELTYDASDQHPVVLSLGEEYLPVDTGDPLPPGFDAVVKIEDIQELTEQTIELLAPAAPWQHVRPVGEDVVAREIIAPALHQLRPVDLGALLAGGVTEISVWKKPLAIIIPTGDELVSPDQVIQRGEIPEFNSAVLAGFLWQWGAEVEVTPIVKDNREQLEAALQKALDKADLVLINAGSSAGREDHTATVIQKMGVVLAHGIATRPGKPTILGVIGEKPLVGLPGYPVSAYLALEWFVRPLIYRYYGLPEPERSKIKAVTGRRIVSEPGIEEFIRVSAGLINGRFVINPLSRGAGVTMSLVRADGLLVAPAESLGYEKGQEVEVELYRPESELRNTVVAVGSHDQALDLIGTELKRLGTGVSLSSSHVGSMGGITAIAEAQAHIAGVHLFDGETGEYNITYVKRFLKDKPVVLVNLAYRTQGWMVLPGNPLKIKTVTDLTRKGVIFINRQRGAGTRLLFDHLLRKAGVGQTQIYGYQREEYTHLNVAAAVAVGSADVGLGVWSAAKAYGLDFVPVAEERYDLLMTLEFYRSELGQLLSQIIKSANYQRLVVKLGGYSLRDAGEVVFKTDC